MSDSVMNYAALPRYKHKPLGREKDEIRVMVLQPGKGCDPLSCKIQNIASLEVGQDQYEAISYVWGAQDNPYNLICDGDIMPIGRNLMSALIRLRSEDCERILWVDQICIDQSNAVEQGAQVKLMARIYGRASKVIVWIGEEDEETANALGLINSVARTFFLDLFDGGIDNVPGAVALEQRILNTTDVWLEFGLPAQESSAWDAVERLLNRPWFTRAWTYQEIIVAGEAAELQCGSHQMGWWGTFNWFGASIIKILSILKSADAKSTPPKFVQRIEYLHQINVTRGLYQSLCNRQKISEDARILTSLSFQLQERRGAQATNPKDKIFSLLNIVHDNPSFQTGNQLPDLFPQPDYEASLQQVYTNAARYCLLTDGHLGMLYDVKYAREDSTLPSWVPDWRVNWQGIIRGSDNRLGKHFSASAGLPPVFWQEVPNSIDPPEFASTREDDIILRVTGARLSIVEKIEPDLTIKHITPAGETELKMGPHFWRILKMCGDLSPDGSKYSFVPAVTNAFTSVLAENDAQIFQTLLTRLEEHWSLPNLFLRSQDTYFAEDTDRQIDALAAPLALHLHEVRMFETNHEDLCLGPATVELGDHVSVLLGGRKPVLLRRTEPALPRTTYSLVGECYTPRAIRGEGVRIKAEILEAERAKNPEMTTEDWLARMRADPKILEGMERMRIC